MSLQVAAQLASSTPSSASVSSSSSSSTASASAVPKPSQGHHSHSHQYPDPKQEMVSVPKDVLLKLVEQKIEAEQRELQTPTKCQCHCQCGRYPSEMLIVDKVGEGEEKLIGILISTEYRSGRFGEGRRMIGILIRADRGMILFAKVMADLLESSSKQLGSDHNSSTNSTPRLSQQFQPGHFVLSNGSTLPTSTPAIPEAMDVTIQNANSASASASADAASATAAMDQLSVNDQDLLVEMAKANEVWKSTASLSPGTSPSGDLQFLLGHYTEGDLRRLISVAKTVESFKRLDQLDQERLLKGQEVRKCPLTIGLPTTESIFLPFISA